MFFLNLNFLPSYEVKLFSSELKHILADKLFKTHISQLTEIADSPFYAKTVLDFNENSRARIEFEELTEELIEKVGL